MADTIILEVAARVRERTRSACGCSLGDMCVARTQARDMVADVLRITAASISSISADQNTARAGVSECVRRLCALADELEP